MRYQHFNILLQQQLNSLVYEINKDNKEQQQLLLEKKPSRFERFTLQFPP